MTTKQKKKSNVAGILKLNYKYFDPIFLNTEELTNKKPALYVGNHTIYGLIDAPLMWDYLRQQHQINLRALGDKIHFKLPVWRKILASNGVVEGSPENCKALMQKGESILVFPGGAREVFKHKDEAYQLIWKNRTGFARMAIEHGYDIIPFAALGGDECFDIQLDAKDVQNNKASQWVINKFQLSDVVRGGEMIPTLATGVAKLPIPKPQRLYFSFGERVSTENLNTTSTEQWQIRDLVEQSIEAQLRYLESYRKQDRKENWSWLRKRLTK